MLFCQIIHVLSSIRIHVAICVNLGRRMERGEERGETKPKPAKDKD